MPCRHRPTATMRWLSRKMTDLQACPELNGTNEVFFELNGANEVFSERIGANED